jgi:hypothetical protein
METQLSPTAGTQKNLTQAKIAKTIWISFFEEARLRPLPTAV